MFLCVNVRTSICRELFWRHTFCFQTEFPKYFTFRAKKEVSSSIFCCGWVSYGCIVCSLVCLSTRLLCRAVAFAWALWIYTAHAWSASSFLVYFSSCDRTRSKRTLCMKVMNYWYSQQRVGLTVFGLSNIVLTFLWLRHCQQLWCIFLSCYFFFVSYVISAADSCFQLDTSVLITRMRLLASLAAHRCSNLHTCTCTRTRGCLLNRRHAANIKCCCLIGVSVKTMLLFLAKNNPRSVRV